MPKKSHIPKRFIAFGIASFILGAALAFMSLSSSPSSSAATLDGFKPGNIISDATMSNYTSMSVADIQNFLTSKNSCKNTDYNFYLKLKQKYPHLSWHWSGEPYNGHFVCLSEERFGNGTTIGEGQTAAEIIYEAAQTHRINPQVLLVLLEKEQSLITDDYPNNVQYRSATGYGCPDTAACDAKYYGLKNQINKAAELFRYTLDNGYYAYPEKTSGIYVAYHPNKSCGSSEVWIENRATAALYRYTPYQPNTAAINAGSGTGDACSAYGNRNFYIYFTKWFGSTQTTTEPESTIIPNGLYQFSLAGSTDQATYYLGRDASGQKLVLADASTDWLIAKDVTTGYYTITDPDSGAKVSRDNTSTSLTLVKSNSSSCSTLWRLRYNLDKTYSFESTCDSGYAFNADNMLGVEIRLSKSTGSASQKWNLRVGETITAGEYFINSAINNDYALDVSGGWPSSGTNIQLWPGNKTTAQIWNFSYDKSIGAYRIDSHGTNYVLDISNGRISNSANIQLWQANNTCAQYWHAIPQEKGYTFASVCNPSFVLDLSNGSVKAGGNIQLYLANNSKSQIWQLTGPKSTESLEGTYTISSSLSTNYVLDISNGRISNSANIQLWQANNTCAQKWQLKQNADDSYTISSLCNANYVLDVSGGWASSGTNIQLWSVNKTASQNWRLEPLQ